MAATPQTPAGNTAAGAPTANAAEVAAEADEGQQDHHTEDHHEFPAWGVAAVLAFVAAVLVIGLYMSTRDEVIVLLRVHGPEDVGKQLMTEMSRGFLIEQGYKFEKEEKDESGKIMVVGRKASDDSHAAVELELVDSAEALHHLSDGKCDVALTAREVSVQESGRYGRLIDFDDHDNMHLVGNYGVAVIVHRENTVQELSRQQVARIFSPEPGAAPLSWRDIEGSSPLGRIQVFKLEEETETCTLFRREALGTKKLAESATPFPSEAELSRAVANSPDSIGFVCLQHAGAARVVPINDEGATASAQGPARPYLFAKPIYLYKRDKGGKASEFLNFVSQRGDLFAERSKLLPPAPPTASTAPESANATQAAADEYEKLTKGAKWFGSVQFPSEGHSVYGQAEASLRSIVNEITRAPNVKRRILLLGFADEKGTKKGNIELSGKRAAAVAGALALGDDFMLEIKPFGHKRPVGPNDTPEGRQKNRRVEIWGLP